MTVLRCTSSEAARLRLPGNRSPGRNRPRLISAASARAICRKGGSEALRSSGSVTVQAFAGISTIVTRHRPATGLIEIFDSA